MKSNELRIGNLVFDNSVLSEIIGIEENRVSTSNGLFPFTGIDKIDYVPLTKEIVLNFGFSKHLKFKNTYCKGCFSVKFTDSGLIYFKYNGFVVSELFYAHGLQNLYFLLSNREELVFSNLIKTTNYK